MKTFRQAFGLRAVCFFDGVGAELYLEGESNELVERTRNAYVSGSDEHANHVAEFESDKGADSPRP